MSDLPLITEETNSRLQKYRLTANQWSERKRGRSRLGWSIETENRDYKASQPNQI